MARNDVGPVGDTVEMGNRPGKPQQAKIYKTEPLRVIHCGDANFNRQFKYHDNEIKTSKYNVLTFIPLNLFEQFHRFANIYFLCLIVLQLIPQIASVNSFVTIIPLSVVLCLNALKDLMDDISRHRSDNKVNNRETCVLTADDASEVKRTWKLLQVGQVICVKNNEPVPADLLIISSSDDNGLLFVETADLDGETNLKVRQALVDTQVIFDNKQDLLRFDGKIECEAPNNNLNRFEGRMEWRGKTYSLNNENILLRGCTLRNTAWAYGIVIFAGKDTKLMKNSGKTTMKRTRLDRLTNRLILCILGFLGLLIVIAAINCFFFENGIGRNFKQYSYWHPDAHDRPAVIAIMHMFSFLILVNTVIPISLYVSLEFIRIALSRGYIANDLDMYYEPLDTPACARTTTLNEELGQIEYIFTDKTGTLTQNIMTFNRCSIAGHIYGDPRPPHSPSDPPSVPNEINETSKLAVDFSKHCPNFFEPSFQFYDWSLVEEIQRGSKEVHEFFTLIALCHTVIADKDAPNGRLDYKAQSPDEAALVSAARNFGFVYLSRAPNSITINLLGNDVTYELLCVLDFDNVRKRMSVIVRNSETGRRQLLCKGADTLILGLLDSNSQQIADRTRAHLSEFAGTGLRTLCLAVKDVDDEAWSAWSGKFHEASTSLENREEKIAECYVEIEQNLRLIGATGVEDKLQVGVPETIYNLAKAGIKIWVLTGDKQETAINIGYSCNMLNDTMEEFIVDADKTLDDVRQQLTRAQEKQKEIMGDPDHHRHHNGGFALIINGPSLMFALKPEIEQIFLEVACQCVTVICCRVTPLQKALVVKLVKNSKKTVTLSIGDGANDVNMIKTAHIGVGISGQEGMQAVLASDFSFAQFRYLQKLLLVHGRWAYLRIAIFLRYFFFKNFAFTMCHFWWGIYNGWSAHALYDQWLIMCYNIIYTSTPIIAYGWFEQDVNAYYSQTYPQLYQPGLKNSFFNLPLFLIACIEGVYDSVISFFVIRYGFADYNDPDGSNILTSHSAFAVAVGTINVIVVTLRCLLEMSYITVLNAIAIFVMSLLGLFVVQIVFAEILAAIHYQYDFYGIDYPVWSSPNFWLCGVVVVFACLFPVVTVRSFGQILKSTLTDRVRTRQLVEKKEPDDYDFLSIKKEAGGRFRRSNRAGSSGYAFSQQPGIGQLVQSGILHEGSQIRSRHGNKTTDTAQRQNHSEIV